MIEFEFVAIFFTIRFTAAALAAIAVNSILHQCIRPILHRLQRHSSRIVRVNPMDQRKLPFICDVSKRTRLLNAIFVFDLFLTKARVQRIVLAWNYVCHGKEIFELHLTIQIDTR